MKKDFHFRTIGIVGWKDKSPDLALALDVISAWATAHPQVKFCALENLKGIARKPIKVVKESALCKSDLLLAIGGAYGARARHAHFGRECGSSRFFGGNACRGPYTDLG